MRDETTGPVVAPREYTYRVRGRYPHDPQAFTQGLVWDDGVFYESVGLYGRSELRRVEAATGRVLDRRPLGQEYWAEGIALVGDLLYQLTWRQKRGFVHRKDDLARIGEFGIDGEGWGLAEHGGELIMSDGTDELYRPATGGRAQRSLARVTSGGSPVTRLNELQMAGGELYANVWYSDRVARIDPGTGVVTSWIDLSGLNPYPRDRCPDGAVLNGIAHDPSGDRLFVTGKLWPTLYEIEVVPCVEQF